MDASSSAEQYRSYLRVLTERTRPEPIFVVAWTGVDCWLRVPLPADVLVRSPRQKQRDIGRIAAEHFAARKGIAGPFGKILGYRFHALPDRAIDYSVQGISREVITGLRASLAIPGEVMLGLKR